MLDDICQYHDLLYTNKQIHLKRKEFYLIIDNCWTTPTYIEIQNFISLSIIKIIFFNDRCSRKLKSVEQISYVYSMTIILKI
jgi:hypothetical protein